MGSSPQTRILPRRAFQSGLLWQIIGYLLMQICNTSALPRLFTGLLHLRPLPQSSSAVYGPEFLERLQKPDNIYRIL